MTLLRRFFSTNARSRGRMAETLPALGTVILFYKYVNVEDPEEERTIQRQWWKELGISGRMRLAKEGVNANLYGLKESIEEYKRRMEASKYWFGIDYKHSNPLPRQTEADNEDPFEGARRIRVSQEITGTGPMKHFSPSALGGVGGTHLTPAQFDELVKQSLVDDDVVIIDTRNFYETVVGKFKNAVDPKLRCFGEFPGWIEANKEQLKNKKVGLYCTGGIRCEKASAFVKSLDVANEVYQLKGGIHSYLTEFSSFAGEEKGVFLDTHEQDYDGTHGLEKEENKVEVESKEQLKMKECNYEGVNFQFDNRYSEEACGLGQKKLLGHCVNCFAITEAAIKRDSRCKVCDNLILVCPSCTEKFGMEVYCPEHKLLSEGWEAWLKLLLEKRWTNDDLQKARNDLERNLKTPVYLQHHALDVDRISELKTQIQRIDEFLEKYPEHNKVIGITHAYENKKHEQFLPYIPFFNP